MTFFESMGSDRQEGPGDAQEQGNSEHCPGWPRGGSPFEGRSNIPEIRPERQGCQEKADYMTRKVFHSSLTKTGWIVTEGRDRISAQKSEGCKNRRV